MAGKAKLPMGIEDFGEMRTGGYYYIDKTGLIRTLLENFGKVNLFTRPRRFGKTLNMSMLKYFFEIGSDGTLFHGLEIAKERELCRDYMGKFPVISLSLKEVEGECFDAAKGVLRSVIGDEAARFQFLAQSQQLSEIERRQYRALVELNEKGEYAMSDELLSKSILMLSRFLQKHYGQRVVVLVDEYDVPLDKGYGAGYYGSMVNLVRGLFGRALKTNNSLLFAALTGCLRISRESIFTGFNNFNVYTVKDVRYNEYFGFTDREVRELLENYGFMGQYEAVREWYDGYRFGNLGIYCPWDVIRYCDDLRDGNATQPQNYWVNTSSNDIIRRFIGKADRAAKDEMEILVAGGTIKKRIRQELTYRDMDSQVAYLWSILFTTGYLTQRGRDDGGLTELAIPNKEIRWIFTEQIQEWFAAETRKDVPKLRRFCKAFLENDVAAIEDGFASYLRKTISIRDTSARKEMKENFFHGILLGLLGNMEGWRVCSNAESGEGYSVEIEEEETGIVIELKYAENGDLDAGCQKALDQIRDRNYQEALIEDGMKTIYRYGIACYKKRCRVVSG